MYSWISKSNNTLLGFLAPYSSA